MLESIACRKVSLVNAVVGVADLLEEGEIKNLRVPRKVKSLKLKAIEVHSVPNLVKKRNRHILHCRKANKQKERRC